ncbi:MAG: L-lactate dehydrogenase [Bacteroidetes bacterium]|nr:L-lactate dehydrogenase [Bacteroidota bacterium]
MKRSIGVIGIGSVGSSVAISILQAGLAEEVLLHDARKEVAEGEAMDMAHGVSFYPAATVRTAGPEEMLEANAIVIAAGRGGKPDESRLELLKDNVRIIQELGEKLKDARGLLIMIANPVDVLTYVLYKATGLPAERVMGTGTMLDTARLRQMLGQELNLEASSIHAQVVGEHGDSEVVLWSSAVIGGISLQQWPGWSKEKEEKIAREVRTAAQEIIKRKGATNHAIGLVTTALLKAALRNDRRVLTVTRVQEGAFGLKGVALSLPTLVNSDGATEILEPQLNEEELKALRHSAEVLRKALQSVGFA